MIRAIVHHGFVGTAIEYFAVVVGPDVDRRFFFEQITAARGDVIRYFGGSSEVVLNPEGVKFRGNGGMFGEYMFGGHLPVGDLLNEEVVNRLVLYGTTVDAKHHELRFTENTQGFETWDNLFLQGNAVANYFFFVDDRKRFDDVGDRQRMMLVVLQELAEVAPVQQLHDEIQHAVGLTEVVDDGHPAVLKCGGHAGLAPEPLPQDPGEGLVVMVAQWFEALDGDLSAQRLVARTPHLPHAAATDQVEQPVPALDQPGLPHWCRPPPSRVPCPPLARPVWRATARVCTGPVGSRGRAVTWHG